MNHAIDNGRGHMSLQKSISSGSIPFGSKVTIYPIFDRGELYNNSFFVNMIGTLTNDSGINDYEPAAVMTDKHAWCVEYPK